MNLKIFLILSLWFASANSVAKTEIDGAFGVKFGDVWTSEDMYFEPEVKLPGFHYYSVKITPLSKKVARISTSNIKSFYKYEDIERSICNSYYKDTLSYFNDVYDNKFNIDSQDQAIYKYKQSTILLTTSFSSDKESGGCWLDVDYINNSLFDEIKKESNIINKEARKKKFKGVDL